MTCSEVDCSAGQSVTVAAQLVIVNTSVAKTVKVVDGTLVLY